MKKVKRHVIKAMIGFYFKDTEPDLVFIFLGNVLVQTYFNYDLEEALKCGLN